MFLSDLKAARGEAFTLDIAPVPAPHKMREKLRTSEYKLALLPSDGAVVHDRNCCRHCLLSPFAEIALSSFPDYTFAELAACDPVCHENVFKDVRRATKHGVRI